MIFTATGASSCRWRASHTEPMPPRESGRSIRYLPAITLPSRMGTIRGSLLAVRTGRARCYHGCLIVALAEVIARLGAVVVHPRAVHVGEDAARGRARGARRPAL